jgi:ornithine cyclodeaminase
VVVEFEPQSRIEGEIQQMPADFKVAEFADVLKGAATGRASPAEVTIFDSVGFALEDYSALRYLHRCSRQNAPTAARSTWCRAWTIPKDLFGVAGTGRSPIQLKPPRLDTAPLKWPVDEHPR